MDKRIIAPVIVTIILVLIQIGYAYLILGDGYIPFVWEIIIELIFVGLIGTTIYELIQRIKEIRSGEEDDLSKY
ncbi:MAG: hypothetical protein JJE03_06660 [Peptostreptococcaceae bacterium]|nr:hypothetical protein [Peptostreptococcaceae bacterium]